jgi:hypothetical protein
LRGPGVAEAAADLDSIRAGVAQGWIAVASAAGALDDAPIKEIGKLCAEQFSFGQIAIVSAVGRQKNPTVATRDKLGPYRLVRADSPESASNLVADCERERAKLSTRRPEATS